MALATLGYGGGNGDDGGEPLEAPEFDLTGQWLVTEIDCQTDAPTQATIDALEAEIVQGMGIRIVQMGRGLEFTDLDDGSRYDGAISEIRFATLAPYRGDSREGDLTFMPRGNGLCWMQTP